MEANLLISPDRPGKTSMWTAYGPRHGHPAPASRASPVPAGAKFGSLDPVRAAFWQAYRHLFPPHALAAQTTNGSLLISWSVLDDPQARYPYAAPVMIRFEDRLLELMWKSDARQRTRVAKAHEAELREGMRGYDPYARVPNARTVVLG